MDVAVCPIATARGRCGRSTIAGTSAPNVGCVTASPAASSTLSAISAAVDRVYAISTQHAAWVSPTAVSRIRLSTRSARRPVSGDSTIGGTVAAISSAATAHPPAPRDWNASTSAVADSMSPQYETPRAAAETYTSRHWEVSGPADVKDMLRR